VAGYIGFNEEDAILLAELAPLLRPAFPSVIEAFLAAIGDSPGAAQVLTGDEAQVVRLRGLLGGWLEGLLGGVYDEAYFEQRARIGRAHVRFGLDQRYMFSAMNLIREQLHHCVVECEFADNGLPSERIPRAHRAVDRICDIELAIMLESYRDAYSQRIRVAERLASLGQLAASIAHDLRNPLAVMETSLHLLRSHVPEGPQVHKHLERIGKQVRASGRIINHLLELATDRELNRETVDLGALVQEALDQITRKSDTRIELVGLDGPLMVSVDAVQLRQLLANLLVNAVQAVEEGERSGREGGRVWVRAQASEEGILLSIEDDGPGIRPEVMERLFEPLFTTRPQGLGLGLALCKQIADKHGATLRALNREDGGAAFELSL